MRRARATVLALSPAVILPFGWARMTAHNPRIVLDDPPSLTFSLSSVTRHVPAAIPDLVAGRVARTDVYREIDWRHARSVGLWYGGRLVDGTQLPTSGPNWVTWDPVTDSVPNEPVRLYGNERTIRTLVAVTRAYRAANPEAPRVVIGDISREGGGPLDEHLSHQNGLDVDVYYPRADRRLRAPVSTAQIDHRLAQDLLDRFVAAGALMVFVGFHSGLHGPSGVVIPYPNHENHMHVRFPAPGA
jgi:murein endopeptidase